MEATIKVEELEEQVCAPVPLVYVAMYYHVTCVVLVS